MSYNRLSAYGSGTDPYGHRKRRWQADNFVHRGEGHRLKQDIDKILHCTRNGGIGRDWRNHNNIRSSPQRNHQRRQGRSLARQNEAFPIKQGVRNDGWEYEVQFVTALAARLAKHNAQVYWVVRSPPGVNWFDDVVAIVTDKWGREYLFMIQLKHSTRRMRLVFKGNPKKQNFIPLNKYLESYNINIGNIDAELKKRIRYIPPERRYFCIFTNMTVTTNNLSQKHITDDHPLNLLDINNRKVYSKWEDYVPQGYEKFFGRLYFLTNQPSCSDIRNNILPRIMPAGFDTILMPAFSNLIKDTNPLTNDLFCQLCACLQISRNLEISRISFRIKDEFLKMWDQIFTNCKQIIIANEDTTPKISSLLCSFYEYKIREEYKLGGSFDWNECYDNGFRLSGEVTRVLESKDKNLRTVRNLPDLVRYVWNKNKMPIMLEERHKKFLGNPLVKKAASGKQFVMVFEFETELAGRQINKFRNVGDLTMRSELVEDILKIDVSLQGRPKVAIGEIVDGRRDILNDITPSDLFDWTSKSQEIPLVGKRLPQLEENYIKRNFVRGTQSTTLSKGYNSLTEEQFIRQLTPGLNVIANGPGTGKTTVLPSLAFHYNAARYVLHISNVASCIRDLDCEELMHSPIDYFFKRNEGENCSKLIQSICKSQMEAGRVLLALDLFDEVWLHCEEKALNILRRLLEYCNSNTKVLIAARSYAARTLKENYPHLQLFQLRELSDEDIDVYIKKCNLPETILRKVDPHLLKIPFYLSTISSLKDVRPENVTILCLYQLFVKRKIDNVEYLPRDFIRWLHKLHEIAAIKVIFGVDIKYEDVITAKRTCMSRGIISFVRNSVEFEQNTCYAEYFAAKWLNDKKKWLNVSEKAISDELRNKVLADPKYRQVLQFLTSMTNNGRE